MGQVVDVRKAAVVGNEERDLTIHDLKRANLPVLLEVLVLPNCMVNSFHLFGGDLGGVDIQCILKFLLKTLISELSLNNISLTDKNIDFIAILVSNRILTKLELWQVGLSDDAAQKLLQAMQDPESILAKLNIERNPDVHAGAIAEIGDALGANKSKLDEEFDTSNFTQYNAYYNCMPALRLVKDKYNISNASICNLSDITRGRCFLDPRILEEFYSLLHNAFHPEANQDDLDGLVDFAGKNKIFGECILYHLAYSKKFHEANQVLDSIAQQCFYVI